MSFKLRIPLVDIPYWSARYEYDDGIPTNLGPVAKDRGHLNKTEFLAFARWKTVRTQKRCQANSPEFVKTVTAASLKSPDERFRIEVLTLLSGVQWPTASVILHFCAVEPYPILDFRALWSLSEDVPKSGYDFPFWWNYCEITRRLATKARVSMRVLDRALWQYSKEKQPAG